MQRIPAADADPASLFRHGGAPGPEGRPCLDFSTNVNPLGPPASLFRLVDLRELVARYPDPECRQLTAALAQQLRVEPEALVIGNGSSELIQLIPRVLGCRRAAIVEPTYTEYLRAARLAGAAVEHWLCPPPDFQPEPFDPAGADLLWLGNPNNPTSRLWPAGTLAPWIAAHPRTTFVVDEAFLPFRPDEPAHSLVQAAGRLPNLIVLRSLTKFYALAGLRLGCAVAAPVVAERLRRQLPPWSVNAVAQRAGWAAILADATHRQETHGWLARDREPFVAQLSAMTELELIPPAANFVLLRLKQTTAAELAARLRERGILVRDASNFVGLDQHHVRVAVRGGLDNRRLVAELPGVFRVK